jgi:acyl-CoA synthetase (AMP-forming)/AMP-acid ligase II
VASERGLRTSDLLGAGDLDAPALLHELGATSYRELEALVADEADRIDRALALGVGERATVLLGGRPSRSWITSYLALRSIGHVPILVGDRSAQIAATWAPVASIHATAEGSAIEVADRSGRRAAELHPDLALLLSTSGSTGSPKLVRLSHENLDANAAAIATSLGLQADDVGITSLPLHYCYGLSVLHSHLSVGAAVSVIDASVVDPCFARALEDHRVTTLAAVPHSLRLLEAAGPERIATAQMRRLTQAGGRLDDDARARWRSRCASWGIDLVIMYGQTEATARMAVLPPVLEPFAPAGSIGVPVPGGSLRTEPIDSAAPGVGELVYQGPNVMMGYACTLEDLGQGPELTELRTGDLGRFDPASRTWVVTGRAARFIKPFGLRIDLDALEGSLGAHLGEVAIGGDDDRLVIVAPQATEARARQAAAEATGLPASAVVASAGPIPRTESGKVDHGAILAAASITAAPTDGIGGARPPAERRDRAVQAPSALLGELLGGRTVDADRTFVEAGGDSLTYVEATELLERSLGRLPDDWQHRPMRELDDHAAARTHRASADTDRPQMDTTVALRALGIVTVVATHMHVAYVPGGAHLLLAVAGYNLSRFHLGVTSTRARVRTTLASVRRLAVPTAAIAAAVVLTTDRYGWSTVALVNNYLGPDLHRDGHWHYWFIEATIQLTLACTALLAVPSLRRAERRRPFAFSLVLLAGALVLRELSWAGLDDPANLRFRTHGVAAFFVLGWLVHQARTVEQRTVASLSCVVAIAGFFDRPQREWYVIGGLLLLTWARQLAVPRALAAVLGTLASASLWIFLSHFHLWPPLQAALPNLVAFALTLAGGVGVWLAVGRLTVALRRPAPTC